MLSLSVLAIYFGYLFITLHIVYFYYHCYENLPSSLLFTSESFVILSSICYCQFYVYSEIELTYVRTYFTLCLHLQA